MGDSRLKVFISSSPGELTDERDAASAAVRTLRLTPLMHELAARPQPETRSDVFVGVYWQRYGWRSEASASRALGASARASGSGRSCGWPSSR